MSGHASQVNLTSHPWGSQSSFQDPFLPRTARETLGLSEKTPKPSQFRHISNFLVKFTATWPDSRDQAVHAKFMFLSCGGVVFASKNLYIRAYKRIITHNLKCSRHFEAALLAGEGVSPATTQLRCLA